MHTLCTPFTRRVALAEELSSPYALQDLLNHWRIAQWGCLRLCVRWGFHDHIVISERLLCPILIACPNAIENGLVG